MSKTSFKSGFGVIELLLGIVIVTLVGAIGWMVYRGLTTKPTSTTTIQMAKSNVIPTSSLASYSSKVGDFTVSYPKNWSIEGWTGQNNITKVPAAQMDGSEGAILLYSSSAKSNSLGVWLTISNNNSPTSSLTSAFTQIPYAQGAILKSLSNGVAIWEANQSLTTDGHTYPDTCTPFETVSDGAFGFRLNNGKYLDASMSFCFANGQTTTSSYTQQANSSELQQAISIVSSLKQD